MDLKDYQERTSVRLDWTVRGLRQLFESSRGDLKSKPVKSNKFGGGRWQILFYPNAGGENGQFISLYLSCEPTPEEKENAVDGKWYRDGKFDFTIELTNLQQTNMFNRKEASEHTFSWNTVNWGWAQFARREAIYYTQNTVRVNDAFRISCSITRSPTSPTTAPLVPHRLVPEPLLNVFGSLLDNPTYSDVVFVLPRRKSRRRSVRKIYAAREILKRFDYFNSMFNSGFAESNTRTLGVPLNQDEDDLISDVDTDVYSQNFEDSDEEDEFNQAVVDGNEDAHENFNHKETESTLVSSDENTICEGKIEEHISASPSLPFCNDDPLQPEEERQDATDEMNERNVRSKSKHPSSPRSEVRRPPSLNAERSEAIDNRSGGSDNRIHITVKDVAYPTYRAVLYYLYTNTIIFAPLSSSFLSQTPTGSTVTALSGQGDGQNLNLAIGNRISQQFETGRSRPTTRLAWLEDWERQNPGKIKPCSAKAVYRVADKLGIIELRKRAFQHIVKSLTVHNIPYEIFSSFSATFEEVRKVEISYFLDHWNEVRGSESMKVVWQQIRDGKHPGFEEAWSLIVKNLEYKSQGSVTEGSV